jgi:hypothetical protein
MPPAVTSMAGIEGDADTDLKVCGIQCEAALDPTVWTGRALQAESADERLVLLFCIRPFVEQIAPGHHGYPRASDLILR